MSQHYHSRVEQTTKKDMGRTEGYRIVAIFDEFKYFFIVQLKSLNA